MNHPHKSNEPDIRMRAWSTPDQLRATPGIHAQLSALDIPYKFNLKDDSIMQGNHDWREEKAKPPKLEHYMRECGWCDAQYRCHVQHKKDLRPAYALCPLCSQQFGVWYRRDAGLEMKNPDYDAETYWPAPDADAGHFGRKL